MYIDTGTFWVIAIGLGIAIGAVYYVLNKKINQPLPPEQYNKAIEDIKRDVYIATREDTKAMAEVMDNNFDAIIKSLDEKVKEICNVLDSEVGAVKGRILAPEDIEKIAQKAIKDQKHTTKK